MRRLVVLRNNLRDPVGPLAGIFSKGLCQASLQVLDETIHQAKRVRVVLVALHAVHYALLVQKLLDPAGEFQSLVRADDPVSYTHLTLPTICSV